MAVTQPTGIPNLAPPAQPGTFFLLAGPCVVENEAIVMHIAEHLKGIQDRLGIPIILKASYKKANRSKASSFTGIGDEEALDILQRAGRAVGLPTVTDVHDPAEAFMAARFVDVLQIPAFLCRQTELLLAAGSTGKCVNIKKGQFLSPGAMTHALEKIRSTGNAHVMCTERGTTFGYQDLVVDFRGIPEMQAFGAPVVLDVTHSLQEPNQPHGVTGGKPHLIPTLAMAGIGAGADGLFIETHPNPSEALSDGANMLALHLLEPLMERCLRLSQARHA